MTKKKETLSRRFIWAVFFIAFIFGCYWGLWEFMLAMIGAGWLANKIADKLVIK